MEFFNFFASQTRKEERQNEWELNRQTHEEQNRDTEIEIKIKVEK